MEKRQKADKNSMPTDDSDGKLHIYSMLAFKGERWGLQVAMDEKERTLENVECQAKGLASAAIRRLRQEKIIYE